MAPTRPVISKPSCSCTNPLVTLPRASITIGIIVTFIFHRFFSSLASLTYVSLFSHSFPQFCKFSFFVDYYKVRSSNLVFMIRLYLETPEEFVHLIL